VALRVRVRLDSDAALTIRTLGTSRRILLAAPSLANKVTTQDIAALTAMSTLSSSDALGAATWTLEGPGGETYTLSHTARVACADFATVRDAAIAGLGIALLPDHACAEALRAGRLVRVFQGWHGPEGTAHLVFTTSRGLPRHVRLWIDHLAEWFRKRLALSSDQEEGQRGIE
jgi:DNA-binding transcriptional LysR family regulator